MLLVRQPAFLWVFDAVGDAVHLPGRVLLPCFCGYCLFIMLFNSFVAFDSAASVVIAHNAVRADPNALPNIGGSYPLMPVHCYCIY